MKIGVISDTHLGSVNDRLRRIMEEHFRDADKILHAGDIGSDQVLAYLETCGVLAVRGNMDFDQAVSALPVKRTIKAGNFKIGLIHGWGSPHRLAERLLPEFDQIDCLVFGHSHQAANEVIKGRLCFNPGSATQFRGGAKPSIGFLHLEKSVRGEIVYIELGA